MQISVPKPANGTPAMKNRNVSTISASAATVLSAKPKIEMSRSGT